MSASIDTSLIGDGLWTNGRDSIKHALDHFSERDRERSDRHHHDKWIILSVHHAAECVCNVRLLELEPAYFVSSRTGAIRFPSLSGTLERLQSEQNLVRLSPAEQKLFLLLTELSDIRHRFMHRTAPEEVDVSIAAMCMIGLLKYIERLKGESASDIVWQSSPIEADVVAAIRYTRLEEYGNFVATFLREKYPDRWLPECPSCGVQAVVFSACEACFTELDHIRCSECDEDVYFVAWERSRGSVSVECQHCGLKQSA
ncbi:MAG: hypothetical protein ABSC25_20995 [Roseiarcus sp.]